MKTYQQCLLRRGNTETTGWIEQRGCVQGAMVELLPQRTKWRVIKVYDGVQLSEQTLRAMRELNWRSLPSVEPIT